ncbi:MAG TPA: glycine zipper 2TM domain-containing protein [Burkholderiales bacterium]|nr:glycine zipper 2TM domain-containing protein [Burkholderiales bacterium]
MMTKDFFKRSLALSIAFSLSVAAGCATPGLGGGDYSRSQTRGEQSVRIGTVEYVRVVRIDGTRSGTGAAGGAVLGGVAGSGVGSGRGQVAGTVAGAILGGVVGQAVENSATKKEGVEITVKLVDSGKLIAVTQEYEPNEQFRVGDRVRILSGSGVTRVSR